MMTNAKENSTPEHAPQGDKTTGVKPQRLKLGIDVHWAQYTVVAQFDGASPRPAQRFTPSAFVEWVKEHLGDAQEVHSVGYEGVWPFLVIFGAWMWPYICKKTARPLGRQVWPKAAMG